MAYDYLYAAGGSMPEAPKVPAAAADARAYGLLAILRAEARSAGGGEASEVDAAVAALRARMATGVGAGQPLGVAVEERVHAPAPRTDREESRAQVSPRTATRRQMQEICQTPDVIKVCREALDRGMPAPIVVAFLRSETPAAAHDLLPHLLESIRNAAVLVEAGERDEIPPSLIDLHKSVILALKSAGSDNF
jgi:hypothetical protein